MASCGCFLQYLQLLGNVSSVACERFMLGEHAFALQGLCDGGSGQVRLTYGLPSSLMALITSYWMELP